MKIVGPLVFLAGIAVCVGCTSTVIQSDGQKWTVRRPSFLQSVRIPSVEIRTNGVVKVTGYSNDGGEGAVYQAVRGAVDALKPK